MRLPGLAGAAATCLAMLAVSAGPALATTTDYGGGPFTGRGTVITDPRVFVVSWEPEGWANGKPGYDLSFVKQFIHNLDKSSVSNLMTQYLPPNGDGVSDTVRYGGDCRLTDSAVDPDNGGIFAGTSGFPISNNTLVSGYLRAA